MINAFFPMLFPNYSLTDCILMMAQEARVNHYSKCLRVLLFFKILLSYFSTFKSEKILTMVLV